MTASTAGEGDAGSITVPNADSISLDNNSSIATAVNTAEEESDAGSINLNANQVTIQGSSELAASTSGGTGGTIEVTADTFDARDGGKLLTATSSTSRKSKAGNIILNVSDNITLAGDNTGLFANTETDSTGDGGSISIDPRTMIIRDGASITVDSQGSGIGGDIDISSGSLTLDNEAEISSDTASTDGGNIRLQINDDPLLLRRQSSISTNAGTAQDMEGNGGNIIINAPFIIAFPAENSDITANAGMGDGGRIEITTNAILGIEFREELTDLSDFTVSSTFGAPGVFVLVDLGIDLTRGLITLPEETVNTEISQGCQTVRGREAVEYFDIGRGGVRPTPYDPLNADEAIEDWIDLEPKSENGPDSGTNLNSPSPAKTQLILSCPAQ